MKLDTSVVKTNQTSSPSPRVKKTFISSPTKASPRKPNNADLKQSRIPLRHGKNRVSPPSKIGIANSRTLQDQHSIIVNKSDL